MVEIILDAYMDKLNDKLKSKSNKEKMKTAIYRLRKLNAKRKIFLTIFLLASIVLFVMIIISGVNKDFFRVTEAYTMVYMGLVFVWALLMERYQYKDWRMYKESYDNELECIRDVLIEFKLHNKKKNEKETKIRIKQLIRKLKQNIQEEELERKKKTEMLNKTIVLFILPIVSFAAGRYCEVLDVKETILISVIAVYFIVLICFFFYVGRVVYEGIRGNRTACKKLFLSRLQDFLDQEFEVLSEDLLE